MNLYESGEYRATKNWPYSICAGSVVYKVEDDELKILLLLRKAGEFPQLIDGHVDSYHLPKGHMEIDETVQQTAIRETQEEAGCEIEIQTYLGAKVNQFVDGGIARDKIVHFFAAKWLRDLDSIDSEHSNKVWKSFDEAVKLIGDLNPKREDTIVNRLADFLELTK